MNGLGTIACGLGLQDALNPCIFMTCAVFIIHGLWLKKRSLKSGWPRIVFGLAYAAGVLEFNFGPAQIFLFHKNFIFTAKILYFVLGFGAFVAGILFLKDWVLLHRGAPAKNPCHCEEPVGRRSNLFGGPAVLLTTVILGLVLSALATLWPINNYIMLLGNGAIMKGQWQTVMPLLASRRRLRTLYSTAPAAFTTSVTVTVHVAQPLVVTAAVSAVDIAS